MRYTIDNVCNVYEFCMEKEARIFGASDKDEDFYAESGIPFKRKRKAHTKYLESKSKEKPTRLSHALGGGAVIGGLAGGGLGAASGGLRGGVAGGLLGAAGGAGLGALSRASDKSNISEAKRTLKGGKKGISSKVEGMVTSATGARRNRERAEAAQRHAELLGALTKSHSTKKEESSSRSGKSYTPTRVSSPRPSAASRLPKAQARQRPLSSAAPKKKDDMPSWVTNRGDWEKAQKEVDDHLAKIK